MDFISAAYIADPDFMLRTRKSFNNADTTHDLFIGIPILNTFDAFKELLNTGTSNIWLIESQELIGHHRLQSGQSQAFNNFIKEERSSIVYTGLDGLTNVRLWQAKSFPK